MTCVFTMGSMRARAYGILFEKPHGFFPLCTYIVLQYFNTFLCYILVIQAQARLAASLGLRRENVERLRAPRSPSPVVCRHAACYPEILPRQKGEAVRVRRGVWERGRELRFERGAYLLEKR
ncbi:hypothetical protein BOTBODRAFT_419983 [Botryobasidium botryosum FD-172 SS1]|uniref:Uncharacterized protein n=1 Tax=Botryobasidium botryosum (strain FD-172 SS1) TaxID=930990 RepID=A0A067MK93_BOTB1|nr:hypothetical protein BOTBODRAFT_419983 [Botryobasidium botryosum FD-172 SS1]